MPLYFFDIEEKIIDEQGVDLPDLASAEAYAAGLVSTFPTGGPEWQQRSVIVRTAFGVELDRVNADRLGSRSSPP